MRRETDIPPLVSVIIPVYNVERYIEKCINSVLFQDYTNLEIILVDDGSSDKCPEICDRYGNKYSEIKVIHQPNKGVSAARNTGLDYASGKYIAFLDSDDYFDPSFVSALYGAFQDNVDIVACAYDNISSSESHLPRNTPHRIEQYNREELLQLSNVDSIRRKAFSDTVFAKLYKKEIWETLRFPEGLLHEDTYVMHRIFFQCSKMIVIPDVLYHRVLSEGSITRSTYSVKRLDVIDAYCDRALFMFYKGYSNDYIYFPIRFAISSLAYGQYNLDLTKLNINAKFTEKLELIRVTYRRVKERLTIPQKIILSTTISHFNLISKFINIAREVKYRATNILA